MRSARRIIRWWTAALMVALVALFSAGQDPAFAVRLFPEYVTEVTAVTPDVDGLSATAQRNGDSIKVTNTSDTPLIVEGYQHEPYLKISADGVWQNQRSPATYLNKEQSINSIPRGAGAHQAPQWKRLSEDPGTTWHDHRIHWMGSSEPTQVAADHSTSHLINTWDIPIRYGSKRGKIEGTLTWYPGTPWGTWLTYGGLALAVVLAVVIVVVGRRRREARADGGASANDD